MNGMEKAPKKPGWRPNLQAFGAGAAIVVSIAALFVAWDEAHIMRRQQYASAMPIVTVEFDAIVEAGHPIIQLRLRNDGVGPAFVESGALRVDGKEIRTLREFQTAALRGEFAERAPSVRIDAARGVLAPGRERAPVRLQWMDPGLVERFVPLAFSLASEDFISFEVCYCSIYRHCWITDIGADPHPRRVGACPQATDIYRTFMTETG